MKNSFAFLLLIILSIFSYINAIQAQPTVRQSLNKEWKFFYKNKSYGASVPGCIHNDLFLNQLIPNPFYENNDSLLQWIGKEDWTYQQVFNIDSLLWDKDVIEISFKGLDTYADVFLNDSLIIKANNMFREWKISCKNLLRQNDNQLKIIFYSAENKSKWLYNLSQYKFPGGDRVMTRKAQFQYGWDFGPRFLTCGIWKDITVIGWNAINLVSTTVKLDSINKETAYLSAKLNITSTNQSPLYIRISDKKLKTELLSHENIVGVGNNNVLVRFTIKDPKKWWCNGYGEPYLYELSVEASTNKKDWNYMELSYGLKTIALIQDPDSLGSSFYFKLNDVPVFMKGANYVPMNTFSYLLNDSTMVSLLDDAVNSHFNMLRIWGGGIYEDDEFYNLCDRKGILIWQDFMFACGMYPFDSLFLNNITAEANEQVSRLSNHVSIALFCGNNENSEGWNRWGWQEAFNQAERAAIWQGYTKIFNEILPAAVKTYTSLPYWESSPSLGRGDKKHTAIGDAHNWFVWHDGAPFENYEINIPRFMSEFGFQSYPDKKTISSFSNNTDDIFISGIQAHQKNKSGNEIIKKYIADEYGIPKTNDDFVYLSQLVQASGVVKGIEAHRRSKPYCMGSLYWQYNDCWPAISWSSRDYTGTWKALQYFGKKAFETFLISIVEERDSISFFIVSDSINAISVLLKIEVFSLDGQITLQKEITTNIHANAVNHNKISKASLGLEQTGNFQKLVYATLVNQHTILSEKLFYFGKSFDLPLKDPKIKFKKTAVPGGLIVTLTAENFAKNVLVSSTGGGNFSDNFFDMLPGKSYEIHLTNISALLVPEIKIKSIFETK